MSKQKKFVLTHGDFNSRNIFRNGFIDVEDSYNGFIGFDFVSLITHQYWSPVNEVDGIKNIFSYKLEDIEKIFNLYKNIFGYEIKNNFDFLFIIRGVWSCTKMGDRPNLQKFRFDRFKFYAEKYINGESVLNNFLDEVKEINYNL